MKGAFCDSRVSRNFGVSIAGLSSGLLYVTGARGCLGTLRRSSARRLRASHPTKHFTESTTMKTALIAALASVTLFGAHTLVSAQCGSGGGCYGGRRPVYYPRAHCPPDFQGVFLGTRIGSLPLSPGNVVPANQPGGPPSAASPGSPIPTEAILSPDAAGSLTGGINAAQAAPAGQNGPAIPVNNGAIPGTNAAGAPLISLPSNPNANGPALGNVSGGNQTRFLQGGNNPPGGNVGGPQRGVGGGPGPINGGNTTNTAPFAVNGPRPGGNAGTNTAPPQFSGGNQTRNDFAGGNQLGQPTRIGGGNNQTRLPFAGGNQLAQPFGQNGGNRSAPFGGNGPTQGQSRNRR